MPVLLLEAILGFGTLNRGVDAGKPSDIHIRFCMTQPPPEEIGEWTRTSLEPCKLRVNMLELSDDAGNTRTTTLPSPFRRQGYTKRSAVGRKEVSVRLSDLGSAC